MDNAHEATRLICHEEELTEGSAVRSLLTGCDLIVIRRKGRLYGYKNECPHMNLPLINGSRGVLNKEQGQLVCAQHAAEFDIENGLCIKGPCVGMELEPVEISLIDGKVFLKQ
jgi:nitrite reductase/ring-hydroxylating ferredoxin subunit